MDSGQLLLELLEHFLTERGEERSAASVPAGQRRALLAGLLTVRPPDPIPAVIESGLDELLEREALARPLVESADLPRLGKLSGPLTRASLWQGDIVTLKVDVIVNAANEQLLGCFVPGHLCIDNVIHAAAGPELRHECAEYMDAQGQLEPIGAAMVTAGYHLRAKNVIHTVGPIVGNDSPTAAQAEQLASCYRSCLDAAAAISAESLAFCAISTGAFGYPVEQAAKVAISTVDSWLRDHPAADIQVIFNTFSDDATAAYQKALADF